MGSFSICVGCSRHVRAAEERCPFCSRDRKPTDPIRNRAVPPARLSRAAIATLTLAGAQAIACEFHDGQLPGPVYGCSPPPCGLPPPVIVGDAAPAPATPRLPIIPRYMDASAPEAGPALDAAPPDASGASIVDGAASDASEAGR